VGLSEGVLDGEPGGSVDEGEAGAALLVLDLGAEAHVLYLVARVGRREHHVAVAHREAVPLVGFAEDLERPLLWASLTAALGFWGIAREDCETRCLYLLT
jgi:hypothetical protein